MNTSSQTFSQDDSETNPEFPNSGSEAADHAAEVVDRGEACVRHHPESAIWSSFAGGLFFGLIGGYLLAEYFSNPWARGYRRIRSRLHL